MPISEYLDDSPILPLSPNRITNLTLKEGSFMESLDLKKNTTIYLDDPLTE